MDKNKGNCSNKVNKSEYVKYVYAKGMHIQHIGEINTKRLARGLIDLTFSKKL